MLSRNGLPKPWRLACARATSLRPLSPARALSLQPSIPPRRSAGSLHLFGACATMAHARMRMPMRCNTRAPRTVPGGTCGTRRALPLQCLQRVCRPAMQQCTRSRSRERLIERRCAGDGRHTCAGSQKALPSGCSRHTTVTHSTLGGRIAGACGTHALVCSLASAPADHSLQASQTREALQRSKERCTAAQGAHRHKRSARAQHTQRTQPALTGANDTPGSQLPGTRCMRSPGMHHGCATRHGPAAAAAYYSSTHRLLR